MKLTADCVLTNQLAALPQGSSLAYILSKADTAWLDLPLEALLCDQYRLEPEPDYPLAAIAASADGLAVGCAYWLRADPVHLMMQRDSFSLSEPLPLQVEKIHAEAIVASLNQHFGSDGLSFVIGDSGAWYLRLDQAPHIATALPSVAVGKNVYQFMPQGEASAKWRAYLNEVQMLLHAHPVNSARESAGTVAINSIWLSGGGTMPSHARLDHDVDLIVADNPFYLGLAQWSALPSLTMANDLEDAIQESAAYQHVRMCLSGEQVLGDSGFQVLLNAVKTRKINSLSLNLGCYERTLTVTMTRLDTFKFWRKLKPVMHFLA